MADHRPFSGAWRVAGHRLGEPGGEGDEFVALVLLDPDGTLTLRLDHAEDATGIGGWRTAGAGRVVARAELFVRSTSARSTGRVVIRAAAELSSDGATARVRLQWQLVGRDGSADAVSVGCEGVAELLRP